MHSVRRLKVLISNEVSTVKSDFNCLPLAMNQE